MDSNAISLQERVQKLINEYTEMKAKLAKSQEHVATLTEENKQLIKQMDDINRNQGGLQKENQDLMEELTILEKKYQDLQQTMVGFESIATDAISKIDSIFPELDDK